MQASLVRSRQKHLLRLVLEFHLNAHLLEGPENFAVEETVNLLPDILSITEDPLQVKLQVLESLN